MLDARGLSCPIPVVMVQRAVKEAPEQLEVLLDNECSVENVTRFAGNHGYSVKIVEDGEEYRMILERKE